MRPIIPRMLLMWIVALLLLVLGANVAQASDELATPSGNDANPVLNIAHFAPFADDVLQTAVTVRVNGTEVFTNVMFGDIFTGTSALPSGTYLVELVDVAQAVIVSETLTFAADKQYSVIATGGANGYPVELGALEDSTTPPAVGFARLRLGHLAPFAQPLDATKVDVCADVTDTPVPNLTDLEYGEVTVPSVDVPADVYDLSIAAAGTNCATTLLDLPTFTLDSGSIYDAFVIGRNDDIFPLRVRSITGLTYQPRISLAHFAPFAPISPTLQSTAVTVTVNGNPVITNLLYSEVTDYFSLPQGVYTAEVYAGAGVLPVITASIGISNDKDYTLAAIGDKIKQPLELLRLEDNNRHVVPQTQVRVHAAHLSAFSSLQQLSAFDVCTSLNTPPLITGFAYKDYELLYLPHGLYSLFVAVPGLKCNQVALGPYPVLLRPGGIVYIYALGDRLPIAPFNQGNADASLVMMPDVMARLLFLPDLQRALPSPDS